MRVPGPSGARDVRGGAPVFRRGGGVKSPLRRRKEPRVTWSPEARLPNVTAHVASVFADAIVNVLLLLAMLTIGSVDKILGIHVLPAGTQVRFE